jgi:hypothetical protein
MVLEIAKPVALLLCFWSQYGVFYAAFLVPAATVDDRFYAGILRLTLAAAIAIVAAFIFREAEMDADAHFDADFRTHFGTGFEAKTVRPGLMTTLPLQLFCWFAVTIVVLFAVSWYVETYSV